MPARAMAVFVIVQGDRHDRSLFRRVGTAFVNRDASLNVILDALPVNGRLHIRHLEPLGRATPLNEAGADGPQHRPEQPATEGR